MNTPVLIACSQLLKQIHITKLDIISFVDMISQAKEKTVLIKIIIDDLFAKIDVQLIICYK